MASSQLRLDIFLQPGVTTPRVAAAVEARAGQSGIEARGAIFTRAEVVDFILDLAGYTADRPGGNYSKTSNSSNRGQTRVVRLVVRRCSVPYPYSV